MKLFCYEYTIGSDSFSGISVDNFFELYEKKPTEFVGVYVIYNESRDMYYVGQAKRLWNRVHQHFTGHGNGDVYADYKYGDSFTITLLPFLSSGYSNLDMFEKHMIEKYNAYDNGYNKNAGNN